MENKTLNHYGIKFHAILDNHKETMIHFIDTNKLLKRIFDESKDSNYINNFLLIALEDCIDNNEELIKKLQYTDKQTKVESYNDGCKNK